MMLYVNGQDIARLVLGLFRKDGEGGVWHVPPTVIPSSPEGYLEVIEQFLLLHALEHKDVTGIAVASGAGSATALRASHALVNAWGFAGGVPLFKIVKEEGMTDEQMLGQMVQEPQAFVRPLYGNVPHITASTKSALRQ